MSTVARRGYRFLADVAVVRDGQPETVTNDLALRVDPSLLRLADAGMSPRRSTRARRLFGFGLALVLAASLSWILYPRATPYPQFAPWLCCHWKTFPAILQRNTLPKV